MNGNKEFMEFAEELKAKVEGILEKGFNVTIHEVTKNNDNTRTGISIMAKDTNIAPTIYLEEFYEEYSNGRNIDEIVNDVLRIYSANRVPEGLGDVKRFTEYEWVKERLIFQLVNSERNKERLSNLPHRKIMDLELVYRVVMGKEMNSLQTVMVTNNHLDLWKVTEEELYEVAKQNTPKIMEARIGTMGNIMRELGVPDSDIDDVPMYIITNEDRINGATVMLYHDKLKQLADRLDSDLYILPSSVHEVIAVPAEIGEAVAFAQMVREINRVEVSPEEVLSDSLYKFERAVGEISIVA